MGADKCKVKKEAGFGSGDYAFVCVCVCVYTCMCVAPCASSPCVSQTQGPPHGVCIDSFVKGGGGK